MLAVAAPLLSVRAQSANASKSSATNPKYGNANAGRSSREQQPTKDRFPPLATNLKDPRRRLAVLVDASKVSAAAYTHVSAGFEEIGVPTLTRIFAHDLADDWRAVVEGPGAVEFFRTERFVPVHMQIAADAAHIVQFRDRNKLEAVVFMCTEAERDAFEKYFDRLRGKGVNQYCYDELGLGGRVEEDGRSVSGA
jgi:hypothetical protein